MRLSSELEGDLQRVEGRVRRLRALRDTREVSSDEIGITLVLHGASGGHAATRLRENGMSSGDSRDASSHDAAVLAGDPGDHLVVEIGMSERDGIADADEVLATSSVRIGRSDLLASRGQPIVRTMPRNTGDGGDYAVEVEVTPF